jgi:hypothetical protein
MAHATLLFDNLKGATMVTWKEKKLYIIQKQLNSCFLIMPFIKLSHHQSIKHYNMLHKRNEPYHYFSNKLKSVFSSCEAFEQMFMECANPQMVWKSFENARRG